MVDITHKHSTLRTAEVEAVVKVSLPATIEAIQSDTVPKGNVFAMSKAAGLLAVKKTPELLPDCHPLPIEYAGIAYDIQDLQIFIRMTVKTVYKTGVEVEAMHGASVVALNIYDMLKPIDPGVEIGHIKLLRKRGGKSQYRFATPESLATAIIVCSDRVSAGKAKDRSGAAIKEKLATLGIQNPTLTFVPDTVEIIQSHAKALAAQHAFLIFTGGTGLGPRDVTNEALTPLLSREIPGVAEHMRRYGQDRIPFAMLSRSVAGCIGDTVVLAVPGSPTGAIECLDAVLPALFHLFPMIAGDNHE